MYIPDNIVAGQFIQFSCDNIDFLEATLDGKTTFLCTQMMAWQRSSGTQVTDEIITSTDKNRKLNHNVLKSFHELGKDKLLANSRPSSVFIDSTDFDMESWLHK